MLCCLGLFAGFALGSIFGNPWTLLGPAIGFGLGLVGDIKIMRGNHGSHGNFGGGCCGGEHLHEEGQEKDINDPVCGMEVRKKSKFKAEFGGKSYYFCSQACLSKFQKDPSRYVR